MSARGVVLKVPDLRVPLRLFQLCVLSVLGAFLGERVRHLITQDEVVVGLVLGFEVLGAMTLMALRRSGEWFFLEPRTSRAEEARSDVVETVVFLAIFLLLTSHLFMNVRTELPLYPLLMKNGVSLGFGLIQDTVLLNALLALLATATYRSTSELTLKAARGRLTDTPLFLGTFVATVPAVGVTLLALLLLADHHSWVFCVEGLIALGGGLLAILGYSHPRNRLGAPAAKLLLYSATAILVLLTIGALLALGLSLTRIFTVPKAPTELSSLIPASRVVVSWPREGTRGALSAGMPSYPQGEWLGRWQEGLLLMGLVSIVGFAIIVGFTAILTILKYQFEQALREEATRKSILACLPDEYRRVLLEELAGIECSRGMSAPARQRVVGELRRWGLLPRE